MPRTRIYDKPHGPQEAYRLRQRVLKKEMQALREALVAAFERGRSHPILDHLPEDPALWVPELTRRLESRKLIACKREDAE